LEKGYINILSRPEPLYYNRHEVQPMKDLLRFLTALRQLYQSICEVYRHPLQHAVAVKQVEFPYPNQFTPNASGPSQTPVHFTYNERVCPIRRVFTATTSFGSPIIVKFVFDRYGETAHLSAAAEGLAPKLLSHSRLPGDVYMVVIEPLPTGFESCSKIGSIPEDAKDAVVSAVNRFHSLNLVHGDLRGSNVFVRKVGEGKWECQLVDFDWAGLASDENLVYPFGVFASEGVWRPGPIMTGRITKEDDLATVNQFLGR
jgi:hypothetical protein